MNGQFLAILRCPIEKTKLTLANTDLIDRVNRSATEGKLCYEGGSTVEDAFDELLINEASSFAYGVRDDIPSLCKELGIPLNQLDADLA